MIENDVWCGDGVFTFYVIRGHGPEEVRLGGAEQKISYIGINKNGVTDISSEGQTSRLCE